MLSELHFASCYIYSPRGKSETAKQSRCIRDWVKCAHKPALLKMAAQVRRHLADNKFGNFFGNDVVLMPVPGSAPRKNELVLWVSEQICNVLLEEGLANNVMCNVRRDHQVQKSAFQAQGSRPNVKTHYDSISVADELLKPTRILLVDDIVTKGCTLLACASRVHDIFPHAKIKAFAMVRTMGLVPDIDTIIEPCVGRIRAFEHEAKRDP